MSRPKLPMAHQAEVVDEGVVYLGAEGVDVAPRAWR
jgi:hypothetical protein